MSTTFSPYFGSSTYEKRHDLFLKQKQNVEHEIKRLNHTLDILKYKCWYYEQAIKDGNEDRLQDLNRKRKIASTLTFLGGCFAATDI